MLHVEIWTQAMEKRELLGNVSGQEAPGLFPSRIDEGTLAKYEL